METALLIIVAVSGGVILLRLSLRIVFAAMRRRLLQHVRRKFTGRAIRRQALNACFFGLRSRGGCQVRGNGVLALTDEFLWFLRALPRKELEIPLRDIVSVTLARRHCGRSAGRPLLRVTFRTGRGEDAAAWALNDPEAWKAAIERRLSAP